MAIFLCTGLLRAFRTFASRSRHRALLCAPSFNSSYAPLKEECKNLQDLLVLRSLRLALLLFVMDDLRLRAQAADNEVKNFSERADRYER